MGLQVLLLCIESVEHLSIVCIVYGDEKPCWGIRWMVYCGMGLQVLLLTIVPFYSVCCYVC